jgi:hypothetical protein
MPPARRRAVLEVGDINIVGLLISASSIEGLSDGVFDMDQGPHSMSSPKRDAPGLAIVSSVLMKRLQVIIGCTLSQ